MNKFKDKMDTLDAILLDFDGVKVVKHHIEHGGISRYKKIQYYYEQYVNKPLPEEKIEAIAQQFSDIVVDKVITSKWVKGAKKFLEKYYNTIDLYVISGTPQKEMELIIKKRNMEKYFKGVYHDSLEADVLFLGRVQKGKENIFPKDIPIIYDFFELF